MVFASTASVYGRVQESVTEAVRPGPLTLYAETKLKCEEAIFQSGIDFVIYRSATAFGVSPRLRLDLLVNDFVYEAVRHRRIDLYEGTMRRSLIHSTDAAAAYAFAIGNFDCMAGRVLNLGADAMCFTKRQIVEEVSRQTGCRIYEVAEGTDLDRRDYKLGCAELRSLGYRTSVPLKEGVAELVGRVSGLNDKDRFRNASYVPVEQGVCPIWGFGGLGMQAVSLSDGAMSPAVGDQ